ncbi:MAG: hypothetical protein QHJ73_19515, partial [Armatimonadota bacterium]|nr:hypothetical protein [Armatimonadota bacterium]
EALQAGAFYGTNGPTLRFEANGARIGSTLETHPGQPVVLEIEARCTAPIEGLTLIRDGRVLREWSTESEVFSTTFTDTPTQDGWYRLEVRDAAGGFAYTNPVWIRMGQ